MIRVSILGATGYSGGELLRLLLTDPGVVIQHITSVSSAGRPVSDIHPALRNRLNRRFEKFQVQAIARDSDVVFSCFPPGVGLKSTAQLIKAGVKVIDLSADYRLPNAKYYKTWYKFTHTTSNLLKKRVYGLPELYRDQISRASLIANPGCYATAAILSAAPLLKSGLVDAKSIIVDAKSGVTGAGKKVAAGYLHSQVNESLKAYAVTAHRHQPEIETVLNDWTKKQVQLTFTPHLVPMDRGILSVLYGTCKKSMSTSDIHALYQKAYGQEPFVRILPEGTVPETKHVQYTNYCDIGVFQDRRLRRVVIIAAIDNLGKGAAGQAVQNMNILFGRSEKEGLQ